MDRRTAMISATAAALAAAVPASARAARQLNRTFLLVHGAWHGGWCWKYVARQLRAYGHTVFTPTLSGLGERHHLTRPDITVATHIQDILNVIEAEELSDVVLVGHSYGGVIIAGVAERAPEKIRRLIFLDALLPSPGKHLFDIPPAMAKTFVEGFRMPSLAPEAFGVPKDHPLYAWVARRLTDMPAATMTSPVPVTGEWAKLPKSFIECLVNVLDGAKAGAARARAEKWDYHTIATGHDAMVTEPEKLARLLMRISR